MSANSGKGRQGSLQSRDAVGRKENSGSHYLASTLQSQSAQIKEANDRCADRCWKSSPSNQEERLPGSFPVSEFR